jgi:hypothetical protein
MFCPRCGHENQDTIFRCMNCGADLSPPSPVPYIPVPGKNSSMATMSLVLGILGVVCLSIFAGIPALILGLLALREIRNSEGMISGAGLAVSGIILGICSILICLLALLIVSSVSLPNFFEANVRSKVSRAKSDQRSLATALECYFVDNSCYPAWGVEGESANSEVSQDSAAYQLPSFRIWTQTWQQREFMTLTTPVAYITMYYKDVFSDDPSATFVYYTDGPGWILVSPGPDGVYDIDPLEDYISTLAQPSPRLLEKCYDPTNGMKSGGDIFRVKM